MKQFIIYLYTAFIGMACAAVANAEEKGFDYSNSISSHVTTFVRGIDAVEVTALRLTATKDAKVLFQFSSTISSESAEGCPCSIRAMVSVDNQEPRVLKRINVGSPDVSTALHYQYDRQPLDGITVFEVGPGPHTFRLLFKQVTGTSKQLEVNYPNAQAFILDR